MPPCIPPLVILVLFWLLLIYQLSVQWSIYEQYHYAWAVPFLCVYFLWRRWSSGYRWPVAGRKLRCRSKVLLLAWFTSRPLVASIGDRLLALGYSRPDRCAWQPSATLNTSPNLQSATFNLQANPSPSSPIAPQIHSSTAALALLAFAAFLYAPTRWLHEANPIWRVTSLLWGLETITLTLCTLYLLKGTASLRRYWLPVVFFLFAVPWPSGLENFVVQSMTRLNTSAAVETLGLMGVPALQLGNVIETAGGHVGIDEACSGIRSLQATLMVSTFLGEFYSLSVRRRVLCVFTGSVVSFLCNLGRTTLLACVAAEKGLPALGNWHDPAGISVLVASFLLLWLVTRLLVARRPRGDEAEVISRHATTILRTRAEDRSAQAVALRQNRAHAAHRFSRHLGPALAICFVSAEIGTELWYRIHERQVSQSVDWSLNPQPQIPGFHCVELRPEILAQFQADEATEARWRDPSGAAGQLFYFRWLPAHSLRKRAWIQLAKSHEPERCLTGLGMSRKADFGRVKVSVQDLNLVLQHYAFVMEGRPLHVFYGTYEDFSGTDQLAPRREDTGSRLAASLAGSRNHGQRLLEVALFDIDSPEDAKAALRNLLPRLLQFDSG